MPQRPSRVIRSSELKAQRGKSRAALRGEIDDLRSQLTKIEEEARRKQAFYDAVTFYRDMRIYGDINMTGELTVIGSSALYIATFGQDGGGVDRIDFRAPLTVADNIDADSFSDLIIAGYIGAADGLIQFNAASSFNGVRSFGTSTGIRYHYIFENGNGDVGSIATNGSATFFNTSSDVSQKEDIVKADARAALDRILAVTIHDFAWKADGSMGRGVLAHELQAIMPLAVTGNPGDVRKEWVTVDDKGAVRVETTLNDEPLEFDREEAHDLGIERPAPQMVDYSKIVPDLVLAVQALAARITP